MIFAKKGKTAQERADQAEFWSGRATALILFGILLEIAGIFEYPDGKSIGEIVLLLSANIAIGTALIIEFICIRVAVRANAEVKLESDEKLRAATDRATTAHEDATAAREELKKFRTPRAKFLTPEARLLIVEKLKKFPGTPYDVGHDDLDREVWDFLWYFEPLFKEAGWVQIDWIGGRPFQRQNEWSVHTYGRENVSNISIEIDPVSRPALMPAATALEEALTAVGIERVRCPRAVSQTAPGRLRASSRPALRSACQVPGLTRRWRGSKARSTGEEARPGAERWRSIA